MLPVVQDNQHGPLVLDPDTGEIVPLSDASDRALAHAAEKLAEHDKHVYALRRTLAHELKQRHGIGKASAGGYEWVVAESASWPVGATQEALGTLVYNGTISEAEAKRCMPLKPKPDARQIKALLGRLMVSNPDAARLLADACSVSPPSVKDVREVAVDAEATS